MSVGLKEYRRLGIPCRVLNLRLLICHSFERTLTRYTCCQDDITCCQDCRCHYIASSNKTHGKNSNATQHDIP